jgi:hypothetical protein
MHENNQPNTGKMVEREQSFSAGFSILKQKLELLSQEDGSLIISVGVRSLKRKVDGLIRESKLPGVKHFFGVTGEGGKGYMSTDQLKSNPDFNHQGDITINGNSGETMTFSVFKYTAKEGFDDYLYFTFA